MKLLNGKRRRRFPAARLALCMILVAAITGGLPGPARACGLAVHHEIVDRAYAALDKQGYPELARLLETYPGAVDAGAVFPDWGYAVMTLRYGKIYSDYAETAHDNTAPSFQQAYLDYLQRAVSPPYSEDEGKMIAFLFGLITHQVADDAWHFEPGAFEGTAMDQDEVSSDFVIEFAANVFVNVEQGQRWNDDAWFFPVEAIRAAYRQVGYDVPEDKLNEGIRYLVAFHQLEKEVSVPLPPSGLVPTAYVISSLSLPWTHDHLVSHEPGGLQDGADKTAAVWQQTWDQSVRSMAEASPNWVAGLSPATGFDFTALVVAGRLSILGAAFLVAGLAVRRWKRQVRPRSP